MLTGPRPFPTEFLSEEVWKPDGGLRPLRPAVRGCGLSDVAVLVASGGMPAYGPLLDTLRRCGHSLAMEAWVVALGMERGAGAKTGVAGIPPAPGRGLPFAYNVALRLARSTGPHHYYWLLSPEVALDAHDDLIQRMVLLADANPDLALVCPASEDGAESASRGQNDPRPPYRRFTLTATPPCSAALVRGEALARAGFLDPDIESPREAMREYALRLRAHGWKSARCDELRIGAAAASR